VRPLADKAANRSGQCLHGNMIKLIINPILRLVERLRTDETRIDNAAGKECSEASQAD
jgi:hypothetical protein